MKSLTRILNLFIIVASTGIINQNAFAEGYSDSQGPGIMMGVAAKRFTFTVYDSKIDTEKAKFEESDNAPMLVITTQDFLHNIWTSWGLSMEFGYADFDLSTQIDYAGNKRNFGTSVEGKYAYAMAMFTLQSSEKYANRSDEHGFELGLGIGFAKMEANGTVRYTNPSTDEGVHTINGDSVDMIAGLYGEYRVEGFFVRFSAFSTFSDESGTNDPQTEGNVYGLNDVSLSGGYSINF